MNTARLKLAVQGVAAFALGIAGIYAAECLECWQPQGPLLSAVCVALVLVAMCLAMSGPLLLSRLLWRREAQEPAEQKSRDPQLEAALHDWPWVASLQVICILALIPIGVFQQLRSSSAFLPMSFVGEIVLIACAREFWPTLIGRWRTLMGGLTSRSAKGRLVAAFGVSMVVTATIVAFVLRLILAQPVVGTISAVIGLVGTTSAAFLAGHTDKNAQQAAAGDARNART